MAPKEISKEFHSIYGRLPTSREIQYYQNNKVHKNLYPRQRYIYREAFGKINKWNSEEYLGSFISANTPVPRYMSRDTYQALRVVEYHKRAKTAPSEEMRSLLSKYLVGEYKPLLAQI